MLSKIRRFTEFGWSVTEVDGLARRGVGWRVSPRVSGVIDVDSLGFKGREIAVGRLRFLVETLPQPMTLFF